MADFRVLLILIAEAVLAYLLLRRSCALCTLRRNIAAVLLLLLAFFIRAALLDYETTDYQWFLAKWVDYYRTGGGFAGLKNSVGNYNIPYLYFLSLFSYSTIKDLYLIKLLSIFFDVILAYACMRLVQKCGGTPVRSAVCFFIVLFLPTVILNSAKWGQCDSIYVAFALLGIELGLGVDSARKTGGSTHRAENAPAQESAGAAHRAGSTAVPEGSDTAAKTCSAISEKSSIAKKTCPVPGVSLNEILSVVCIAVSFSFKLQAVFIMPVYVILWLWKKYKIRDILIFPLTYFIMILPAILLGRPVADALLLYVDQAETVGTAMNYNSPSMTALIRNVENPEAFSKVCIVLAFLAVAAILTAGILLRKRMNSAVFLGLTLLMVLVVPFLLPHMHDRYFFLGDCLTVVFACAMTVRRKADLQEQLLRGVSAGCMQFGSLVCYLAYFKTYYLRLGNIYLTNDRGAVAVILCILITLYGIFCELGRTEKSREAIPPASPRRVH